MQTDPHEPEAPDPTDLLWSVGLSFGFGARGGAAADGRARSSSPLDAAAREFEQPSSSRCIDHFELIEEIGHGGMGAVYRARDLVLEREVAVKVLLDPPSRFE